MKSGYIQIPANNFALGADIDLIHLARFEGLLRSVIHHGIF